MLGELVPVAEAAAQTLRVAVVGEVDHGKSTLLGRILLDTGAVTPDRLRRTVEEGGLAFLLDALSEEQKDMFTLDTVQAVLETPRRRYVLIDVPGHEELLKNMVTGASRADVGVVVVDGTAGAQTQTRRHIRILEMLGVTVCVVAVTKMDLLGYDQQRFLDVATEVCDLAVLCGIEPVAAAPVSSLCGANVIASAHEQMPWYDGEPLIDLLHTIGVRRSASALLRFAVQGVVGTGAGRRVIGRVESGKLVEGQELHDAATGGRSVVERIQRFGEVPLAEAHAGDGVGLTLRGCMPRPGAVLAPPGDPLTMGDRWRVRVLSTSEAAFGPADECVIRHCSASLPATIEGVEGRWNSATLETAARADPRVHFSEVASLWLRLDKPVGADRIRTCAPLGRFMLCDSAGEALGLGIIDEIGGPVGDAALEQLAGTPIGAGPR